MDSRKCLVCNPLAKNRFMEGEEDNYCECVDGYYEGSENSIDCVKCPIDNCKKCNSNGECLAC